DVMLPAGRVLLQELGDRAVLAQRLQQLDLAVRRVDEAHPHALCRQVERFVDLRRTEQVAIHRDAFLDRRRRDADMVEAAEVHGRFPLTVMPAKAGILVASEICMESVWLPAF